MAFNTVGIQDNLPVLPIHVLQIIQSLTEFGQTYSAEDFFREGRTNFGSAAFTSSAHVEMHSYNGADPLVVYSGQYNDTEVFSIDVNGTTNVTSLTGSNATITTLAVANEAVINSAITTATVNTATIQTATVSGLSATNGVITTLNSTVGAIATFTASNAQVTNTANIATANVTNLRATNANLTGSLLGSASYASDALSASYAATALQADSALTASFVTASNVYGPYGASSALSASYAITASYALNTAASTPGGGNLAVQLNNANASFTGSQNLVWDTANTFLINKGYYTIDYATNSGGGLLARSGTPATNSFQLAFNNQARYGGTINQFSGRQVTLYDFQAGGVTAYRAGMNEAGDFFIGNSNTNYSARFQQPTQSTNIPLTLKGASGQTADLLRVTDNSNTSVLFVSASGLTSGSFKGNLAGTASFAPITAGPGITVNGMEVTASVRTVNGISPTNGNIAVSLAGVLTGTSASLVSSGSGAVTASISNGALWVISGDITPANNGDAYIFQSGSVGAWLPIAPLDTAAGDARYLMLNGANPLLGNIDFNGSDALNAGTWTGTAYTASFVTASNVYGPYGASSVLSSSYAVTSSFAVSSSYALSSSFAVSSSYALSSSFAVSASWAPQAAVNTTSFITTGSISTTQTVTGSLRVTGSGLTVTGSIIATQRIASIGGTVGLGLAGMYIYPSWTSVDFSVGTNTAGFAHIRPANTGIATLTVGPTTYYWSDINIGPDVASKAGSIKIATDTGNTSPSSTITYTLVSHGNNVTDNNNIWKTANGRDHALTVSGSMLARDSVSLGTNIANSHIITGSINMTGSFTLNGTNLNTLVSPIQSVTVNLTQSDILNLGSGIQLIALPGINKLIVVHRVVLMYKFNTQQYINTTGTRLYQGATAISNNLEILQYPSSAVISFSPSDTTATLASSLANQPLQLFNNIGNPSGGDGTMKVVVYYEIVDLP